MQIVCLYIANARLTWVSSELHGQLVRSGPVQASLARLTIYRTQSAVSMGTTTRSPQSISLYLLTFIGEQGSCSDKGIEAIWLHQCP